MPRSYGAARGIWRGAPWLVALGLSAAFAPAASAGPVEDYAQLLLNDAQPERVVLGYGYGPRRSQGGLLISNDGGHSFALICNAALAPGLSVTSALIAGDGAIVLAGFDGLQRGDGSGCGFQIDRALAGRWVTDLAADPRDPEVIFALASGAPSLPNGLFRSIAGGPFAGLRTGDEAVLTRLRLVRRADGGVRLYVGAIGSSPPPDPATGNVPPAKYLLRVSDDDGVGWREHVLDGAGGAVRLQAVDPSNADRVLIAIEHDNGADQLMLSEDAGERFTPYLTLGSFGGLARFPDGRLFIGDGGDAAIGRKGGLWQAASFGAAPELVTDAYPVRCLGRAADGALLGCQRLAFGAIDPSDGAFTPRFAFGQLEQLVSCPGSDVRALCEAPLLAAYCGLSHFPCAPMCDDYRVDLSPLAAQAADDAELAQCLERRGFAAEPPARGQAGDAAPEPPPDTPRTDPPRDHTPGGDCRALSAGHGATGNHAWLALAGSALLALSLRRRRSRAQRQSER